MMPSSRVLPRLRPHLLLAISAAILVYVAYDLYRTAEADAAQALSRLQTSRRQAEEIRRFRDRPAFAATTVEDVGALTRRIASARQAAEVAEQAVDLVSPQRPVRLGDSAYQRRPIAIDLRGLTLPQTVRFTDALTDREAGMWVDQLRLTPVRSEQEAHAPELWNVEIVLTQLIFSPTTR